jgi:glycosyltransferase involved in cell wall biosynthesis
MTDTPSAYRPTVLQVLPSLVSGGVERGTLEIAKALKAAGWRSVVASEGGILTNRLLQQGSQHVILPLKSKNPWTVWRNAARLVKLIQEMQVDVVHARSRAPAWSAYLACKRTGTPLVTTYHGTYADGGRWKKWYNGVMSRGKRVIAISNFIYDHVAVRYPDAEGRMTVIPRGVDVSVFNPDIVRQDALVHLANKWRLPEELPIIFMPARLTRWKGHEVLIDALAGLEDVPFFCIMAGDEGAHSGYREELEQKVLRLGLGGKVRIVEATDDMPAAYLLSHVVVCPSQRPEAFGRVPVEAGVMGRPVIAADHGGAQETIKHGVTGWLVKPDDVYGWRDAIRGALTMPTTAREAMGKAATKFVLTHFTTRQMCESTLKLYSSLLKSEE